MRISKIEYKETNLNTFLHKETITMTTNIDDEWQQFILKEYKKDGYDGIMHSHLTNDENEVGEVSENACLEEEFDLKKPPKCDELFISTKTKCLYLSEPIDIERIFWGIHVIDYYKQECGVVKKQKKIVCHTPEEYEEYKERLGSVRHYYQEQVIKMIDNVGLAPEGTETRVYKKRFNKNEQKTTGEFMKCKKRVVYKNERKLTVGMCKKDIINSRRKKKSGAFYNCFALIVRFLPNQNGREDFQEFHVKVFNTGKMEIPGRFSKSILEQIKQIVLDIIQPFNQGDKPLCYVDGKDGVLINSNFKLGYFIDRDRLYTLLRNKYGIETSYNSSSYQGVKCKYYFNNENGFDGEQTGCILEKDAMKMKELAKTKKYTKISFMIFRTGSCIIVGNCTKKILYFIYEFIKTILTQEYANISTGLEMEKNPNAPKKIFRPKKMNIHYYEENTE